MSTSKRVFRAQERIKQARLFEANNGHNYANSDHCEYCGAEQYESEAYFAPCEGTFEIDHKNED